MTGPLRYFRGALLALALCGSACWVPAETGKQMQADILTLQRDLGTARAGVDEQRAKLTEQMTRADQQIEEVAKALAELQRAARNTDADFGVQMERMIKELQELRGVLELTEYRLQKLEGQVVGDGSLASRLEAAEKRLGSGTSTTPVDGAVTMPAAEPKSKDELLANAKKLVKDEKVAEARGIYREITKRWPNEANVTDAALFALGELYFAEKKYPNALTEYIKVAEKFPTGKFGDEALFKIGLCSMELADFENAQVFFSEIVKKGKKSSLYKQAQAKQEEVAKRLEQEKKKKSEKKDSGKKNGKK